MATQCQNTTRHLRARTFALACALALVLSPAAAFALTEEDATATAAAISEERLTVPEEEVAAEADTQTNAPEDATPASAEGAASDAALEPQEGLSPTTPGAPAADETADNTSDDEAPETSPVSGESTDADGQGTTEPATKPDQDVTPEPEAAQPEPAPTADSEPKAVPSSTSLTTQATSTLPSAPTGATAKAVTNGGTYVIQSLVATTRVVAAESTKATAGTNVVSGAYKGANAQKWVVSREGNSLWYRLLLAGSGGKFALGVSGSNVCVVKNPTGTSKLLSVLWSFVSTGSGTYRLVNASATSKALDVTDSSTKAGANLRTAAASTSKPANQSFRMVDANPSVAAGTKGLTGAYTVASSSKTSLIAGTKSASRAVNASLTLQVSDGTRTQHVYLQPDGKGYYIAWIVGSGRALTVAGASILPGTKVVQRVWQGAEHQRWAVVATKNADGTYAATLQNKGTGLFLGATSATAGTVVTGQAKGGANTKLTLTKQGLLKAGITCITPMSTAKTALSIPGAKTGTSKVVLWNNTGTINQRFELKSVGTNLWRIRTASSGGWLTWKSGSVVHQMGSSATAKSKADTWKAVWKNGGISLVNLASGKALQMSHGKTSKGTTIVVYKNNGSKAQHFAYTPAPLITDGVYLVDSKWEKRRLRVDGDSETPANISNPTYGSTAETSEKFKVTPVGSAYKITNVKSGLVMTGGGYPDKDGYANVSQKRNTGANNQLWKAQIGDGGYVEFVNVASGKYLVSRNNNSKSSDGVWPGFNVVERDAKQKSTYLTGCSWKLKASTGTVKTNPVRGTTVLLIGNSFTLRTTSKNVPVDKQIPTVLKNKLGSNAYVDQATLEGKSLAHHLNTNSSNAEVAELARQTMRKIYFGDWDAIVIQEKTSVPLDEYSTYLANLKLFVNLSKKVKATPIIYSTWAYTGGLGGADERGISVAQMHSNLQSKFTSAFQATGATIANVGEAFKDRGFASGLYDTDNKHPSETGCALAASVISATIKTMLA